MSNQTTLVKSFKTLVGYLEWTAVRLYLTGNCYKTLNNKVADLNGKYLSHVLLQVFLRGWNNRQTEVKR